MPDTIRFPSQTGTESNEIITLFTNTATIFKGAQNLIAPITGIQQASRDPPSSAFLDLVIEFTADQVVTIGDGGANFVGLFGEINPPNPNIGSPQRYLLGILGVVLTVGSMPQIPIIDAGINPLVGFSQIIQAAACYDHLGVGAINADIPLGGPVVTCKIRPLVIRSYPG